MSVLKVTKLHPLAKRGEPWVPIVRIPIGEHPLSKHPDWAVARLVELGHAEVIEGEKGKVDEDPAAAEALAAAKAEEERLDRERADKAKAKADADAKTKAGKA